MWKASLFLSVQSCLLAMLRVTGRMKRGENVFISGMKSHLVQQTIPATSLLSSLRWALKRVTLAVYYTLGSLLWHEITLPVFLIQAKLTSHGYLLFYSRCQSPTAIYVTSQSLFLFHVHLDAGNSAP